MGSSDISNCNQTSLYYLHFLRLLIDHIDNIDIRNDRGFTPLHIASRASLLDNVLLLLDYGANPNAKSDNGTTPLHRELTQ